MEKLYKTKLLYNVIDLAGINSLILFKEATVKKIFRNSEDESDPGDNVVENTNAGQCCAINCIKPRKKQKFKTMH